MTTTKIGTSWATADGIVTVYMVTLGRDAVSVAAGCRNWEGWGYDAHEATADDCPPEVPEGLVVVSVPVARFDEFVRGILCSSEEHYIFPTVELAWASELGEVDYDSTPHGAELARMAYEAEPVRFVDPNVTS